MTRPMLMRSAILAVVMSAILAASLAGPSSCESKYPAEYQNGSVAKVSKSLKANPKLVNKWLGAKQNRGTLLSWAVDEDNLAMATMLLSNGANVHDAGSDCEFTPLHFAKSVAMAGLLISNGADVNRQHVGGRTSLHTAIMGGRKEIVELLIRKGADVNAVADHGSPLQYGADWGRSAEIVKLLLVNGAKPVKSKYLEKTPLELAESRKDKDSAPVKAIIDVLKAVANGADPASLAVTDPNYTPEEFLHWAKYGRADKAVEILRANPALLNVADENGTTALHYAADADSTELISLLLAHKADVNARKNDGVTPLHIAAALGKLNAAQLLLAKGANPNARDAKGRTPLTLAKEKNYQSVVRLLSSGAK